LHAHRKQQKIFSFNLQRRHPKQAENSRLENFMKCFENIPSLQKKAEIFLRTEATFEHFHFY